MITGAAAEDCCCHAVSSTRGTAEFRFHWPRIPCDVSAFQFPHYVGWLFFQFDLQIGDIFFKTNDPLLGHDG
jgi:hypothetical protein